MRPIIKRQLGSTTDTCMGEAYCAPCAWDPEASPRCAAEPEKAFCVAETVSPPPTSGTAALGEACDTNSDCSDREGSAFCSASTKRCKRVATEIGAACEFAYELWPSPSHAQGCDSMVAGLTCVQACNPSDFVSNDGNQERFDEAGFNACRETHPPTCQPRQDGVGLHQACGATPLPHVPQRALSDLQACNPGLYCSYSSTEADIGRCEPIKQRGETCNGLDGWGIRECADGLSCDQASATCQPESICR